MATTKAIAEKCKVCNIEIRLLQLRKIELVNQFKPMFPSRKLQKPSKFFKLFRGLIKGTLAQHG